MGELLIIHKIIILSNEVFFTYSSGKCNILDSTTDNFLESWQVSKFTVECSFWEQMFWERFHPVRMSTSLSNAEKWIVIENIT